MLQRVFAALRNECVYGNAVLRSAYGKPFYQAFFQAEGFADVFCFLDFKHRDHLHDMFLSVKGAGGIPISPLCPLNNPPIPLETVPHAPGGLVCAWGTDVNSRENEL